MRALRWIATLGFYFVAVHGCGGHKVHNNSGAGGATGTVGTGGTTVAAGGSVDASVSRDASETSDADMPSPSCPKGWYLWDDWVCGYMSTSCSRHGNGLCYQPCATSSDCTDPGSPECRGAIDVCNGSDYCRPMNVCAAAIAVGTGGNTGTGGVGGNSGWTATLGDLWEY